jgi:hypothetical protein
MGHHLSRPSAWLVVGTIAGLLAGCVYESSNTCGPNMRYESAVGVCVCNDDAIADGGGCTACAADEVVVGSTCACPAGETKNADHRCAVVPGLGTACAESEDCTEQPYDFCASRDGTGSCTNRCVVDTDCPASYVCADWEPVAYCRIYTGYGATCATDECASYDASFCIQGHCAVQGCTLGVDDCPRDTKCCDFSSYGLGTMCAPAGSCP